LSGYSKEQFLTLLKEGKTNLLADLVALRKGSLRYLNRLLYHPEDLVRWRAVEAMGLVAQRLAGEEPEAVRNIIRNLLWTINEESGGIGWSSPHCLGEIIYRLPDMFGEFASIIISFVDEQMLRRGVAWAAGRIAQARPGLVREEAPRLMVFLGDPDPVVRGYTLRFLYIIGEKPDFGIYPGLKDDPGVVPLYENGSLRETTVAHLAALIAL